MAMRPVEGDVYQETRWKPAFRSLFFDAMTMVSSELEPQGAARTKGKSENDDHGEDHYSRNLLLCVESRDILLWE